MRSLAWPFALGAVALGLGCGGKTGASPTSGAGQGGEAGSDAAAPPPDAPADEVTPVPDAPANDVVPVPDAGAGGGADGGWRDVDVPTFDAALVIGCASAYGPPCPVTYLGTWTILGNDPSSFSAALAPDGSLYLGGTFSGPTDIDPTAGTNVQTPVSSPSAYLTKIGPAGNYIRSSLFQGEGYFGWGAGIGWIAPSATSVVATGGFNSSIDLDPGPGVARFDAGDPNGSASFMVSLTSDGVYLWGHVLPSGNQGGAYWGPVAVAPSGAIYVAGNYNVLSTLGAADLDPGPGTHLTPVGDGGFMLALDGTGGFSWVRVLGGDACKNADVLAVALTADGSLWMLGRYQGTCAFDAGGPSTGPAPDGGGMFLASLTPAGQLTNLLSLPAGIAPSGLTIAGDGSLYITGRAFVAGAGAQAGLVDFDPSSATTANQLVPAGGAVFILNLDATGAYRWVQLLGPSLHAPVIAAGPGGGALVAISPPNAMSGGMTIYELGADGHPAWQLTTGGGQAIPSALLSDANGFYVTGMLYDAADLDPSAGVDHFVGPLSFVSRYKF